jgi:tellurite resistance-related uncharacterized protein
VQALPPGARVYKSTAVFDEHSVPRGLLARHTTRRGVWARIRVLEGELAFRELEPELRLHVLTPGRDGIVAPEAPHEVEPRGAVRFVVEFLRDDAGGPADA